MPDSLRIVEIRAHEVIVPVRPGHADNPELAGPPEPVPWYDLPICLLEVVYSDGIIGLGEMDRGRSLASIADTLQALIGLKVNPGLMLGNQPEHWRPTFPHALQELFPLPLWASTTAVNYALSMASLDAQGKRLGARAVDLLGGAYRESFAVDFWCARRTPADLSKLVEKAVSLGFRGLKMKSRAGDPTVEQARAVRDAGGPQFGLTIDPMFQWLSPNHVLTTIKPLEALEMINLRIEDPFPQDQPDFWKRWHQASSIPLIWHARTAASLRQGMQCGYSDAFNLSGGIVEVLTMSHALEILGKTCWFGSSIEMGVGQACRMHAAAASRTCTMACDFVSGIVREHTLITWDWPYREGRLPLPAAGPGLGVELDRDALRHYTRAHKTFH